MTVFYMTEEGETLQDVADIFGVSQKHLIHINDLDYTMKNSDMFMRCTLLTIYEGPRSSW